MAQISAKRFFGLLGILVAVAWGAAIPARAQKTAPLKPVGYVNDFAGVLSQSTKFQITALCTEVNDKTHAQIAVVTVNSLEGRPIEDFAVELFKQWGIGPKETARGILILLSVQDRRYRFEVGYGLEPILPDGKTGEFGREAVPYLREGDYNAAVMLMVRRVAEVIARDRGVVLTVGTSIPARQNSRTNANRQQFPGFLIIALLGFLLLSVIRFLSRASGLTSGRYRRGGGGWWIGPMIGGGWGGGGWGGGFGGGGGGGGFGGFGGGGSGGGGASGSW